MRLSIAPAFRRFGAGVAVSVVLVACSAAGGSPTAPSATPTLVASVAASPASAASSAGASASLGPVAEVDAVIAGLDQSLALYKSGKTQDAINALADTYEDHFEKIEAPLEAADKDLKEDLESSIATKLRAAMTANTPAADVEKMVTDIESKLATARGLLH